MCSPLGFRTAQRTSTDSANRSESPACLDLSAQGRRHSESLTRTYIPSEHSCLGNPTSLYFSSRIRLSSHHDPQETLNVSGILSRKDRRYFLLGEGGYGCCPVTPGQATVRMPVSTLPRPCLLAEAAAVVVGRETVPLNRIRKQHLLLGQGPWSHRQGQAQRCS